MIVCAKCGGDVEVSSNERNTLLSTTCFTCGEQKTFSLRQVLVEGIEIIKKQINIDTLT